MSRTPIKYSIFRKQYWPAFAVKELHDPAYKLRRAAARVQIAGTLRERRSILTLSTGLQVILVRHAGPMDYSPENNSFQFDWLARPYRTILAAENTSGISGRRWRAANLPTLIIKIQCLSANDRQWGGFAHHGVAGCDPRISLFDLLRHMRLTAFGRQHVQLRYGV